MIAIQEKQTFHYHEQDDNKSISFEEALKHLTPNPDFLHTTYDKAFNWDELVSLLPSDFSGEFYCVAFRSTLKTQETEELKQEKIELLYRMDEEAHQEALQSGGLLKYWYASPDTAGRNLATCLWHSRDHAVKAARLPWHRKAAELIGAGIYRVWTLERYSLKIEAGHHTFQKL